MFRKIVLGLLLGAAAIALALATIQFSRYSIIRRRTRPRNSMSPTRLLRTTTRSSK